jgi:hypothetical protein
MGSVWHGSFVVPQTGGCYGKRVSSQVASRCGVLPPRCVRFGRSGHAPTAGHRRTSAASRTRGPQGTAAASSTGTAGASRRGTARSRKVAAEAVLAHSGSGCRRLGGRAGLPEKRLSGARLIDGAGWPVRSARCRSNPERVSSGCRNPQQYFFTTTRSEAKGQ